MRYEQFRSWMEKKGNLEANPISNALSRCRRLEKVPGINLDVEYARDGGKYVIEMLTYSTKDERACKSVPVELEFSPTANLRNGMASLKNAAKLYIEFCREER